MKHLPLFLSLALGATAFGLILFSLVHGNSVPLLEPLGSVGIAEHELMMRAVFLMLIVVIPVIILSIFIAWHYRESNTRAKYTPKGEHSLMEELIWWSIPFEIVLVLAALTWNGTFELDPSRALESTEPPLTIQVVALPWKWLFIYPEEGIASVNEFALPVHRPVRFEITADAPMNSFWIPALGGQMYAMTGMMTVLNLNANEPGEYPGRSANYSGEGFSQMQFSAKAMSEAEYDAWIQKAQALNVSLTSEQYAALRTPSTDAAVRFFGHTDVSFADIVNSYMLGSMTAHPSPAVPGMDAMHHLQ